MFNLKTESDPLVIKNLGKIEFKIRRENSTGKSNIEYENKIKNIEKAVSEMGYCMSNIKSDPKDHFKKT